MSVVKYKNTGLDRLNYMKAMQKGLERYRSRPDCKNSAKLSSVEKKMQKGILQAEQSMETPF